MYKIKQLFQSRLFLAGLLIKLCFLFLCPSHFPRDLFLPFLDRALLAPGVNPWSLSPPEFFPYGGALFTLLFFPKYVLYLIFGDLSLGAGPLGLLGLKLPLLFCDLVLLTVLASLAAGRRESVIKYYWLNPVLFYITYIYGQLDVVSMTFLMASIACMLRDKRLTSALLMGLAIGSKFHVAICVPYFMTYMWNREFYRKALPEIIKWLGVVTAVVLLAFLPVLMAAKGAYATLGSPEVERLFAMQIPLTQGVSLYVGIILLAVVLGRLMIATRISELGLIFGSGLLLSSLVVSSHAAAGWFYWCMPFLALFFAMYLNVSRLLFWAVNLLFFMAYVFAEPILGLPLGSIWYSALQAGLIANLFFLWTIALNREVPSRKRDSSLRIGIAGDSGAGKSFLASLIQQLFGSNDCLILEGDDYHKWERGDKNWDQFTHLHPQANHLFHLSQHIRLISQGRPFEQAIYSHETGKFIQPVERKPSKTLIVEGLHSLYFETARRLFDLKIFIEPDQVIRQNWKLVRDVAERGQSKAEVLQKMSSREEDAQRFISPQKQYADLIIRYHPGPDQSHLTEWIVWNDMDLSPLAQALTQAGVQAELQVSSEFPERIQFKVQGILSVEQIQAIAHKRLSPLRHLTRVGSEPQWVGGDEGITQLITLLIIKLKLEQDQI